MSDHSALIERLEMATGPDRDLDVLLFVQLGGDEWRRAYMLAQEPSGCSHETAVRDAKDRYAPRYTASLDAAIALCERVLPGAYGSVQFGIGNCQAVVLVDRTIVHTGYTVTDTPTTGRSFGPTPAVALCIAILRALSPEEEKRS